MTLDELDRLAAEKVMGWHKWDWPGWRHGESHELAALNWQPTRNIAQAWECLEKLNPDYVFLRKLTYQTDVVFTCRFNSGEYGRAKTAPEAIVLACLKAKRVEL